MNFCNFSSKWIHEKRLSNEYIFYLIIDGNMYIKENETEYHLKKGDLIFLEPGITHEGYQRAAVKYFYFHFHHDTPFNKHNNIKEINKHLIQTRKDSLRSDPFLRSNKFTSADLYIPKTFTIKSQSSLLKLSNILYECRNDIFSKLENYKIFSANKVLEALILIAREYTSTLYEKTINNNVTNKSIFILNKLTSFIKNSYNQELNIISIEDFMQFSYDYLNTLFKESRNMTIGKYIQIVRINEAKRFIQESNLSFKQIAYKVGINDPYYFSKLFKKLLYCSSTLTLFILKYFLSSLTAPPSKIFFTLKYSFTILLYFSSSLSIFLSIKS